jgi:exodeoxyribonuclease VII large subunit
MFKGGSGGEHITDGSAISLHGRVSVYEVRGDLQCIADIARPEGLGERFLELEKLKVQLEAEGLFEPSRKRPIPSFPKRVGVITSPTGAVWHDIQNVVGRRYPLVELVLAACQVQGDNAAPTIIEAFDAMNAEPDIDVVILARGGGSAEELWAFNEEAVARAVYGSKPPIISAVGHETNTSVADMVADLRAPTPSAAAEMAVPDSRELNDRVLSNARKLYQGVMQDLANRTSGVQWNLSRMEMRKPDTTTRRQQVDDLLQGLALRMGNAVALHKQKLVGLDQRLGALDPASVLRRGYAAVSRADTGDIVSDASQVGSGDAIRIRVHQGEFGAKVDGDGKAS